VRRRIFRLISNANCRVTYICRRRAKHFTGQIRVEKRTEKEAVTNEQKAREKMGERVGHFYSTSLKNELVAGGFQYPAIAARGAKATFQGCSCFQDPAHHRQRTQMVSIVIRDQQRFAQHGLPASVGDPGKEIG
jgi:hypothetical protein